ncbi:MAG: endo-1,4-beta-xylanase [Halioglobus sp.]|nr:endo-1,4-beta-xylanase [Halioglobus sp.]
MLYTNIASRIVLVIFLCTGGCADNDGEEQSGGAGAPSTLKSLASFPIGNAVFSRDDARFVDYDSNYSLVLDTIKAESDYVGHDELFRIRETHPSPYSTDYSRLDAFVEFAESEDYRIHGHNLLFYSDIGIDSWISEYRSNGTWSRDQWRNWLEQYIKGKVARYKGRVASWDVLNEPLPRVLGDEEGARNIFIDLAGNDIYAKAFQWAREADPQAILVLNEFFLGPNGAAKTDDLIALADEIGRSGGKVDVIGFEGIYFFSPMISTSYSYNYERFKKAADAGYMVTVSELNIGLNTFPAAGVSQRQTRLMHSIQRKAFNNIVRAYMDAVPPAQRWGMVTWGVADYSGFLRFGDIFKTIRLPGGGSEWPLLWNDDFDKKPAYYGFISALKGLEEPFKYASVYDEGELSDDLPFVRDFKADLLSQLDIEKNALIVVPSLTTAEDRYYEEVQREILASPNQ